VNRLLATALTVLALPFSAQAQWQFDGVPVSTAVHYQVDPIIVTDGAGGAIIAWYDYRNGNYDIYAQRLNAAGVPQWTTDGIPICTQPGNQITYSMVSDDAGGAVIVWEDARNSLNTGLDVYAQRVNGSGAVLWTADGTLVCGTSGNQNEPIVIKSANNYVVTWFDARNLGVADIYVQALNSSGSWQWVDPDGVALCTAAGNQFHPRLATDGVGGAIVTWEDRRSGPEDIYARRVDQLGAVQWTADGVLVCNATAEQYSPQIVGDGAAGAIIAWYDWRSGSTDIYMQRIDSSGSPQWTANGSAICTAPGPQDSPSLVQDAGGGATVVWADKRNGANTDIYAQHVNSSGVPYFAANGVALCTAGGNQSYPRITRDAASAGIVAWFDYRSGNPDIYAQRIDYLTGAPLWTPNGVVLCTEPHLQEFPNLVSDGGSGAIVAWRDLREGNYYDVYAEHVNGNGPTAVGNTPAATSLRAFNYPNPFTGTTTLEFVLRSTSNVAMEVFDVRGQRVWTRELRQAEAGRHAVSFSPTSLPSGVYFYRIHAGAETVTKKMVIAR
jgi:Secretion system C-terminal sorting domain